MVTGGRDPRVRDFERLLDDALAARPMMRAGGTNALRLAANVVETADAEGVMHGHHLSHGLQILAPTLIDRIPGNEIDVADVVADLDFAGHYSSLRDLLYYTYNAPGTTTWTFGDCRLEIRYADASLPRQFFMSANTWLVDSMAAFADRQGHQRIEELLRGTPEFELTPAALEAQELIQAEVDLKLRLYFNLVTDVSAIAGAYTFGDFMTVYSALLTKALYHRYHARVNGSRGIITMSLDQLARDLESSVENVSAETARRVVTDISYGVAAREELLDPVYFSLYHLPDHDQIVMLPYHFALWEGIVSFLRLVGLRNPQLFLRSFSQQIGDALVSRLSKAFQDAGFGARSNVSLRKYDVSLPDIDLLVISEERTLGYAMLACEVKSPVPPVWAKDQLRALEADSIAKAFEQLTRINAFLRSEEGVRFITEQLPRQGLPDFDEFAVLLWTVVATSDNAGAFFADRGAILDFRTLERLLTRCDGDMLYVLTVLKDFPEWADNSFERVMADVQVGDLAVSYEAMKITSLMDFRPNTFLSADAPEFMVRDMLERGDRPLDVFRHRGVDSGDTGDNPD